MEDDPQDLSDKDPVKQIDEHRYVISTEPGEPPTKPTPSKKDVESILNELNGSYKIFIRGDINGVNSYYVVEENEIDTAFEELTRWYAIQIKNSTDLDTPVEDIINKLLSSIDNYE